MSQPDARVVNPAGTFRVVVTKELPGDRWLRRLTAAGCRVEILQGTRALGETEIRAAIGAHADAVIGQLTEPWTASLLERLSQAGGRIYSQFAVGHDNVDVEAATRLGLPVGNTPGVLTETTAEMTVALTFAAARRVAEGDRMMRAGGYHGWLPDLLLGSLLSRGTVGIVGAGRIGTAYARMMVEGHKMDLVYYDVRANDELERYVTDYAAFLEKRGEAAVSCRRAANLHELLGVADVVSIHAALTAETRHLIGAPELAAMKDDAILVNASRGPLVDEAALVEHCRTHPRFRAGLDVFEREPAMQPGLAELDNVVVVPHLGSATTWTREGMATLAAANVAAILLRLAGVAGGGRRERRRPLPRRRGTAACGAQHRERRRAGARAMERLSRDLLLDLFSAAVAAADPALLLPGRLPQPPAGRTLVVGAGKAAAAMARAVEREWDGPLEGLVVTRYGHAVPCERIEVVEAAHPVPDAAGRAAAGRILALARGLSADDLLVCLISGGGSALLALPADGVSLEDKRAVNAALLRSGATIAEMNCVRKHLSAVKGGRLAAAAHPARVVTYLISDVPGDDPSVIASGPTVPDPTTFADALAVLERYGIDEPPAAIDHLRAGAAETPKPGDPAFGRDEVVTLATAADALEAAAAAPAPPASTRSSSATTSRARPATSADCTPRSPWAAPTAASAPSSPCERRRPRGAAHLPGSVLTPPQRPFVLLSGGETTVTVLGDGRGGRNAEYALGLALGLDGRPGISAVAGDTDGIDGTEDNAGAVVTPDTLARARAAGLDPVAALAANDAYGLFAALGDLVVTGPTLTNVNDFRAILVE